MTADELPKARVLPDQRTNSILVTASEPQHADIIKLLQTMDSEVSDKDLKLEIISLQNATASSVAKVVENIVVGRNPGLKERVQISAQEGSNVLVVRAPAEQIAEIKEIITKVDTAEVSGLPVRSVKLERADAQTVATALQKFFQERAQISSRAGQRATNRVAVAGDRRSGTLIVSASDEDFAQVQSLVATFDQPAKAKQMQMKIIPLQNARVSDRFVEDGTYLRLKNVQLGYSLPKSVLKKLHLQKFRLYTSAQNLYTLTKYSGMDPEIGAYGGALNAGIDRGFYPQARVWLGGVSVVF